MTNNVFRPFAAQPAAPLVLDRMGRPIEVGDAIHIMGKSDVMWQVQQIRPLLDPRAPGGTVEVTLVAGFTPVVPAGQKCMDVLKVLSAAQTQRLQAEAEAQVETPQPPTTEEPPA